MLTFSLLEVAAQYLCIFAQQRPREAQGKPTPGNGHRAIMEPASLDIFTDRQQASALVAGVSREQQVFAKAFRSVAKVGRVTSASQAVTGNEMSTKSHVGSRRDYTEIWAL